MYSYNEIEEEQEMEKNQKLEVLIKILVKKDEESFKCILWQLTSNPAEILKSYGFDDNEENINEFANELRFKLLEEYKKIHSEFYFGEEKTKLNTYGVTINIDDPIVRDTILEHCENISSDSKLLRYCILNLCTKKDSIEYSERRLAAFNALEFTKKEKEFIENSFDTYCIGEVLKAIQRTKYPLQRPSNSNNYIDFEACGEKEGFAIKVLKKKDKIMELFDILNNISSEEIVMAFLDYKSESRISEVIADIRNDIDPKIVFENKQKIEELFKMVENM